ncbi:MAG TPA: hypothetical protein VF623_04810 [Segetibacter sp.]|jgi:flagellar biosynthesis component FlhA
MVTFAELVESVENLSKEEMVEMKRIMERKWMDIREQEIIEAVEEARRESEEGKTVVLSSPQEIKSFFDKMMNNGG